MNAVNYNEWLQFADNLHKRGFNYDEISSQLLAKGTPENLLQEIIDKIKSIRLTRKRKSGFICCGVGVTLLVVGCLAALLFYQSESTVRFAMYGLTTIGVLFSLKGLADIMGW
ncbi:MAG: hypothetical protein JNM19_12010 [Chitinophagaceae bacterium]|nr:hypothetical protein [Chitinophagaceae bacterium]